MRLKRSVLNIAIPMAAILIGVLGWRYGGMSGAEPLSGESATLVRGNNQLALDLLGELGGENSDNLFFSPFSISTSLAMLSAGAGGITQAEIQQVLHCDQLAPEQVVAMGGALQRRLTAQPIGGTGQLLIGNALWVEKGFPLAPVYRQQIERHFEGHAWQVNFAGNSAAATQRINRWVADATEGRIDELFRPGDLDQSTALVLTNAVFFKDQWTHGFDVAHTQAGNFYVDSRQAVEVPFMRNKDEYPCGGHEDFTIVELPYKSKRQSMVILLPDEVDGLPDLERTLLGVDGLHQLETWLANLKQKEVTLHLPKWSMSARTNLGEMLRSLGMATVFDAVRADFSPMLAPGHPNSPPLVVDKVIHEARLEVDEQGTVAAAATGIAMTRASLTIGSDLRVDRPFLLLIRDTRTGAILFLGRVTDPTGGASSQRSLPIPQEYSPKQTPEPARSVPAVERAPAD